MLERAAPAPSGSNGPSLTFHGANRVREYAIDMFGQAFNVTFPSSGVDPSGRDVRALLLTRRAVQELDIQN